MKTDSFLCPTEPVLCRGGPCSLVRPAPLGAWGCSCHCVCFPDQALTWLSHSAQGVLHKARLDSCHNFDGDMDLSHSHAMCLRISLNCQERPIFLKVVRQRCDFVTLTLCLEESQKPVRFPNTCWECLLPHVSWRPSGSLHMLPHLDPYKAQLHGSCCNPCAEETEVTWSL